MRFFLSVDFSHRHDFFVSASCHLKERSRRMEGEFMLPPLWRKFQRGKDFPLYPSRTFEINAFVVKETGGGGLCTASNQKCPHKQ